jgi:serine/threonine protein phosphatase 1
MRSYVLGDIHGCLDELRCLLDSLPLEPSDRVVFLGDYVDRGPDPQGVISLLIERQKIGQQDFIFLKGNHEDMFLSYLDLPSKSRDIFLFNGGGTTLASYGIPPTVTSAEEAQSRIPRSHIDFLKSLRVSFLIEPFLCVHAGIHPLRPLDEQKEKDLLWIRDEFIFNPHALPYTVLFGHTPHREVFFDLPYKIGLDTGLVYGNQLSCLEVQDKTLFQIERRKKTVVRKSVANLWTQKASSFTPGA